MVKKLSQSIREYKKPAILSIMFTSLEVIIQTLLPLIVGQIINEGIQNKDKNFIISLGIVSILIIAFSLLFAYFANVFCAKATIGFSKNLRKDMFYKVQTYSFYNIDKISTSSLITRLTTDVTNVQNAFQMIIRILIRAPLTLFYTTILTFVINWVMALILLGAGLFLSVCIILIIRKAHPLFEKVIKQYDTLNTVVEENIRGARVVKSCVREDYEEKKFNTISEKIFKNFTKARRIVELSSPVMQFSIYASMILISYFGAQIIVNSGGVQLNTGDLTSLFSYGMQILISLMMLSLVLINVTIAKPSAERIVEVLNEESQIQNCEHPIKEVENGDILYEDVGFSYEGDISKLCLKNINLHISSGMTVGILGNTGSSKTTLISLIPRLYDTTSGNLYVAGKNVKDYDIKTLRDNVALVLQKNVLFSGTIKENLLWGNKHATDEQIKKACDIACASEFIEKLPNKYDTVVEQGGANFSGGQKQRICIARAILKNPKILILDDSTSAVDTKTDSIIRQAFKTDLSQTTKLIISQKIQNIKDSDLIIVMNSGCIQAQGTHEELLKSCELYKEIYNLQTKKGGKK